MAAWLRQMGHRDVFVVEGGLHAAPVPRRALPAQPAAPTISPAELAALTDVLVVDLSRSIVFREGHCPSAVWAIRTRLSVIADRLAVAKQVVLTSPDGVHAAWAAAEAAGQLA